MSGIHPRISCCEDGAVEFYFPLTFTKRQYYINICRRFTMVNAFKSKFTIAIFIHYKPRIAVAILDL